MSKIIKKSEILTEKSGTPAYIAPEVLKENEGYSGFASDFWSAGIVLYAMLYGTVPFKASQMNDLHKLIIEGKYSLKEDISEESRDLLSHLLDPNPINRYGIPEIIRHKWYKVYDSTSRHLFSSYIY